jgi:Kazal-type serine protease inhibitor domain
MNRFIAFARIGLLGFAAAAIPLSTGCGLDVNVGESTGTGGHTGAGGSCSNVAVGTGSGVGGGPDTTVSTTVGAGGKPGTSGTTSTTSVGAGGGPTGVHCGGLTPSPTPPCAADEYCYYGPQNCGSYDNQGICKKRPDGACPPVFDLTCGCDGQTYDNECEALEAGTDVNVNGCTPPVGQFACGAHFCMYKAEYCVRTISDVLEEPPTFSCQPVPAGCALPNCACLSGVACGDTCQDTGVGQQVTCYVGG